MSLIVLSRWRLSVYASLLHQITNRLLKIINTIAHFINATNDRSTHLIESMLLRRHRVRRGRR